MKKPKGIKVYLNGEQLRDIYPHATKWQVFKWNTYKFLIKVRNISFLLLVAFSLIQAGRYLYPLTVYKVEANEIIVDNLTPRINKIKAEALQGIKECESAGHNEDDGIIIFDTNKKASIGSFQFQKATVIYYYKSLYGKEITPKEAVLIALDDEKATSLAKDILFNTNNGSKNWINCGNKINIQQTLATIKQIQSN